MKRNLTPTYASVAYGFVSRSVVSFIAYCRNIVLMMTDNAAYPAPAPALADVTAELDTLETMAQAAQNGDRIAIANRNAQRAKVTLMMRQLGAYVQNACNGDLPTLLSSGFEARKVPTTAGTLPAPANLRLYLSGNSGEILAKWDRVWNSGSYLVQVATEPNGEFTSMMPCTAARMILSGLTPLKQVWVRVCANGAAGQGLWSSVISITVV